MADYKALYRKWRPRDFDDVCGQDGVTDILKYEVANSKLSHAYLFSGSRGTGKTSCAKILAKAVNCENPQNGNPCNKCDACRSIDAGLATDVIEMDAASNNGIDHVRDMQDEIAFTPALLNYRVYIIDEVHMMSTQAFNALLKTLEEPPAYVIFILATTEYNKLPTTIVSRCQRFDFKRISSETIMGRLLTMAEHEEIEITEDAARVIARVSRGGMRDAISLLELCAGAHTLIDENLVFQTVGSGSRESAYKIIEAVANSDYSTVYGVISDIVMKSGDLSVFWQELIDSYRDIMVVKNTDKAKAYLDLTDVEYQMLSGVAEKFSMSRLSYHVTLLENAMADMQRAFNSKRSIAEIALTRMCNPKLDGSPEALLLRIEELEREMSMIKLGVVTPASATQAKPADPKPMQKSATDNEQIQAKTEKKSEQNNTPVQYSNWGKVLGKISEIKKPLSAGLASAEVTRIGAVHFVIKLKGFFAKRILDNPTDYAIVKGIIAETEKMSKDELEVEIVATEQNNQLDLNIF